MQEGPRIDVGAPGDTIPEISAWKSEILLGKAGAPGRA